MSTAPLCFSLRYKLLFFANYYYNTDNIHFRLHIFTSLRKFSLSIHFKEFLRFIIENFSSQKTHAVYSKARLEFLLIIYIIILYIDFYIPINCFFFAENSSSVITPSFNNSFHSLNSAITSDLSLVPF